LGGGGGYIGSCRIPLHPFSFFVHPYTNTDFMHVSDLHTGTVDTPYKTRFGNFSPKPLAAPNHSTYSDTRNLERVMHGFLAEESGLRGCVAPLPDASRNSDACTDNERHESRASPDAKTRATGSALALAVVSPWRRSTP
jgi:hypothetical protein